MKIVAFLAALSASVASVGAFSAVKVGGKIPAIDMLYDFEPEAKLNLAEYTANKKVAVVGLPGAFTPTW
jgi:peroxiredoxin